MQTQKLMEQWVSLTVTKTLCMSVMCGFICTCGKEEGTAHTCSVSHQHSRREKKRESQLVLRFLSPPNSFPNSLLEATLRCHLENWGNIATPLFCAHSAAAALCSLEQATPTTAHRLSHWPLPLTPPRQHSVAWNKPCLPQLTTHHTGSSLSHLPEG